MADQVARKALGSQAGFSLIEVLVVISILSVLAVGVGMVAGRGASVEASDATMFTASYGAARDRAIHGQLPRGLYVTARGVQAALLAAGKWEKDGSERRWRGRLTFVNDSPVNRPQVVFLPNGQASAVAIDLVNGAERMHCESDGFVGLTCAAR